MVTKAVYAAFGFGIGSAFAWAITSDIYERRIRDERKSYDEMIKEKTEHIWSLQDRLDNPRIEDVDTIPGQIQLVDTDEEVAEEAPKQDDEVPAGETVEETRSNLQELINRYTADPEAQEEFAQMTAVVQENQQPFVISRENYAYDEEGQYYEKITLKYYPDDRVLLDDEDEPIEDVNSYVGWRNLSRFGDDSGDPSVVFVRNNRLEIDFEVVKEDETPLPLHVKYGMEKEEFRANRAAGLIKLRQEDE